MCHLMPLVSLAEMPFAIPCAFRTVAMEETEPVWPSDLSFFFTNLQDNYLEQISFDETLIDEASLDTILNSGDNINSGPFAAFFDNWREAQLAARNRSSSIACILAATSSELLIRETLSMLMWEEGMTPLAAAHQICKSSPTSRSVTALISSEFSGRLGGSWDRNGDSIVARHSRLVFQLRNSIVHGGYRPSNDEGQTAIETCREFFGFIENRLIARMAHYPLVTRMFVGYNELVRRGLSDRIDKLVCETIRPLNVDENLMSYRSEVARYCDNRALREGAQLSGNLTDAHVALLVFPTGKIQWWLVDYDARLACLAQAPKLNRRQERMVRDVRRRTTTNHPYNGAVAMRFLRTETVPTANPPTWYLMYKVWPLFRVDRFPSCPMPIDEDFETSQV